MMNRLKMLSAAALLVVSVATASADSIPTTLTPSVIVSTTAEPVVQGKFEPTWQSLSQYQTPDWFRDAKFGIWAHWGPQCQPEDGDWYARNMYNEGSGDNKYHVAHYGPPSQFGFKDVINTWKAEKWDPEAIVALYKRAGAQYFFALADHHDNFDLWDSAYQPWNSTAIGPKKNIIAGWAKAARDNGLKFGVSVHASHAWSWYEVAQGADKKGPLAGVAYDGKLTKADGKGRWWEGLDPQDLYAQNHTPGAGLNWEWDPKKGSSTPDQAYCQKFYNRTADLIHRYHPDLIYFDDTALPLWPVSDAGLKLAADFYNDNLARSGGQQQGVIFGKVLDEQERHCMTWDLERGQSPHIEPLPWQTDTCLGNWHYDRALYDRHGYKSAKTVIQILCDVVSKNGNLLLNVPLRGDGSIDDQEMVVVQGITAWMDVNKEAIFGTRPWKVLGEGPSVKDAPAIKDQGFNEGKVKLSEADIRFISKGQVLYVIALGQPTKPLSVVSLGTAAKLLDDRIESISILGSDEKVEYSQADKALTLSPPKAKLSDAAVVYKVTLAAR